MLRSAIRALTLALAAVTAAAIPTLVPGPALAQAPEQTVRIVFPFAAGGSGDALSRLIAEHLRIALDRPVIVENRTGAQGRLGVQAVKAATPDGSTILLTPVAPMSIYQHVYKALGYDPVADFAPVSQVATFDFAVAIGPAVLRQRFSKSSASLPPSRKAPARRPSSETRFEVQGELAHSTPTQGMDDCCDRPRGDLVRCRTRSGPKHPAGCPLPCPVAARSLDRGAARRA